FHDDALRINRNLHNYVALNAAGKLRARDLQILERDRKGRLDLITAGRAVVARAQWRTSLHGVGRLLLVQYVSALLEAGFLGLLMRGRRERKQFGPALRGHLDITRNIESDGNRGRTSALAMGYLSGPDKQWNSRPAHDRQNKNMESGRAR